MSDPAPVLIYEGSREEGPPTARFAVFRVTAGGRTYRIELPEIAAAADRSVYRASVLELAERLRQAAAAPQPGLW